MQQKIIQAKKKSKTLPESIKKQHHSFMKDLEKEVEKGQNVEESYQKAEAAFAKSTHGTSDQKSKKQKVEASYTAFKNYVNRGNELLTASQKLSCNGVHIAIKIC